MKGTYNLKHPHQKPYILYDAIIKHFSSKNDLVLDYFVGSGIIAKACINNDRRFIGTEIDADIYELLKCEVFVKTKETYNFKLNF